MEQVKRGPGRPPTGKPARPRKEFTISPESVAFMKWLLGEQGNQSGFVDEQIKAHPQYEEWRVSSSTKNS